MGQAVPGSTHVPSNVLTATECCRLRVSNPGNSWRAAPSTRDRGKASCGLVALLVAILVAVFLFTMPGDVAIRAGILGAVTGFFPIGWIVLNVIFMYR